MTAPFSTMIHPSSDWWIPANTRRRFNVFKTSILRCTGIIRFSCSQSPRCHDDFHSPRCETFCWDVPDKSIAISFSFLHSRCLSAFPSSFNSSGCFFINTSFVLSSHSSQIAESTVELANILRLIALLLCLSGF